MKNALEISSESAVDYFQLNFLLVDKDLRIIEFEGEELSKIFYRLDPTSKENMLHPFMTSYQHLHLKQDLSRLNDGDVIFCDLYLQNMTDSAVSFRCKVLDAGELFRIMAIPNDSFFSNTRMGKSVFEVAKIGYWTYDPLLKVSQWSDGCKQIYELPNKGTENFEEVLENYEILSRVSLRNNIAKLYEHHEPYEHIGKYTVNGKVKYIKSTARPIVKNNKVILAEGTTIDYTDQYHILKSLESLITKKDLAIKGVNSAIFHHDLASDKVTYGSDFLKLIGLDETNHEVLESEFRKRIHLADANEAYVRHVEQVASKEPYYFNKYRLIHADGSENYYEVHAWKHFQKNVAVEMVGNLVCVEQRVRAERAANDYLNFLEEIIENNFVHTIILSTDGRILHTNRHSITHTKEQTDITIKFGETLYRDIVPQDRIADYEDSFKKALEGERIFKEFELRLNSGASKWVGIEYKPLHNSEGSIDRVAVVLIDLSEIKKSQVQVYNINHKKQQLDKLRDSIVSNLSNQVMSPLAKLKASASEIESKANEDVRKIVSDLQQSLTKLEDIINEVTSVSLVKHERELLEAEIIPINEIVTSSFKKHLHIARKKNLELHFVTSNQAINSEINREIFTSIIDNVINNAIKYSQEGAIGITITKDTMVKEVSIIVKDTGIGMDKDVLENLFYDFENAELNMGAKYEGSGISLSLCRKYLRLVGGDIMIDSQRHKGTTVVIRLKYL